MFINNTLNYYLKYMTTTRILLTTYNYFDYKFITHIL